MGTMTLPTSGSNGADLSILESLRPGGACLLRARIMTSQSSELPPGHHCGWSAWSRDSIDHRSTEASSRSGENAFVASCLVMITARWGQAPSWRKTAYVRRSLVHCSRNTARRQCPELYTIPVISLRTRQIKSCQMGNHEFNRISQ